MIILNYKIDLITYYKPFKWLFFSLWFYKQSESTITVTDSSTPERIMTVTGNINVIQKAFSLITQILEQVIWFIIINSSYIVNIFYSIN